METFLINWLSYTGNRSHTGRIMSSQQELSGFIVLSIVQDQFIQ